jgi:hypothetical protein
LDPRGSKLSGLNSRGIFSGVGEAEVFDGLFEGDRSGDGAPLSDVEVSAAVVSVVQLLATTAHTAAATTTNQVRARCPSMIRMLVGSPIAR